MQFYNNTLCISYGELVNKNAQPNIIGKGAFISKYDYQNYKNSGKLKSVRRGCRGTDPLYDFELLPMEVKKEVAVKYKDVIKSAQQEPFKALLQHDYAALSFFETYTLPNGENLKANTIREYTSTAVVLNAIIKLQSNAKAWQSALGKTNTKSTSLKNLTSILDTLQPKWGWKLPSGDRAMRGKISKYKTLGYVSLISGKLCNDNAAKVAETEQEAALRRIMALGRNFDDVQVMSIYNVTAEVAGWKKITKSTVANKRDQWQIYTDAGSRGKSNHDSNHAMQVKRRAPSAPLLYWTADGWDVELLYQKSEMDRNGNDVTTYHHRLSIVVVLDPCGKYPIGYAIGTHETPYLIRQAFRNAIKHTAELFGEMHHVYQLQTDNYNRKALTPFYEALSKRYTPARVKNAKAKVIEPYFKYLNKQYCQLLYNWSGFGQRARKEHQPNEEYLNKIRHTFPDQQGCIDQIVRIMENERNAKRDAYIQAYSNLSDDKKLTWTRTEFLNHLGETSGDTNKLYGHGVPLQINKHKYIYDSFDPSFRMHRNEDWIIKYDPTDMSEVLAVNSTGSLKFMLGDKYTQPMALAERQTGDAAELQKIYNHNDSLVEDILNVQDRDYEVLNGLMQRNPRIEETLGKLLLTDSNGQHKDNKSHARIMQNAEKLNAKQERRDAKQEEKTQMSRREEYLNSKLDFNDFLNK